MLKSLKCPFSAGEIETCEVFAKGCLGKRAFQT